MFNSLSPLRYRWPFLAKLFFFLLTIAMLAAPIPYVFFKPGVPNNVTGQPIEITDAQSFEPNGKLFITSILVTNQMHQFLALRPFITGQSGHTQSCLGNLSIRHYLMIHK